MGSKFWWKVIDKLIGCVGLSMNFLFLFNVNDINIYFQLINIDISYVEFVLLEIILEFYKVFVIYEILVFKVLVCVKRIVIGLDDLFFWFWKEYVLELIFVIIYILNVFLVFQ